jgi:hypothetical protein
MVIQNPTEMNDDPEFDRLLKETGDWIREWETMTFTIEALKIRFTGRSPETLLHFVTFHCGPWRFSEFSDDGHKTHAQAKAYGKRVCATVNSKKP